MDKLLGVIVGVAVVIVSLCLCVCVMVKGEGAEWMGGGGILTLVAHLIAIVIQRAFIEITKAKQWQTFCCCCCCCDCVCVCQRLCVSECVFSLA